jgi:spermidine synthase
MNRLKHSVLFALLGFAAIVGQIILQRRFLVVFGGNELTIGVVFAGWMLWAGIGNLVAGRFADRLRNPSIALIVVLLAVALFLPATILAASLLKVILGVPLPQMMGMSTIFAATLILLFPFCFCVGMALVLAAKIPATETSLDIGEVYIFDSLGSACGGLLFSWVAIRYLTPLQASLFVSVILAAGAGLLLLTRPRGKFIIMTIAAGLLILFFNSRALETHERNIQWKGYNPIADFDSRFGNIVVTQNRGEHTLFFDGVPQFSTPLPETYETAAYLPLLMHRDPHDVLLIGGGLSGMIHQWRDVDLASITYVQIDPDITAAERKYMVPEEMISDPRLKIHFGDGRNYLKSRGEEKNPPIPPLSKGGGFNAPPLVKGGKGGFDVIIVQAGDPATAATNRYYTKDFFEDVKGSLNPDGIVFFGVFEPTNYVSTEAQDLLGSVYASLQKVFGHVVALPLDKYYFIASAEKGNLTDDIDAIRARIKERALNVPNLSAQVLYGIYPERVALTREFIEKAASRTKTINTDRHPIAYYAGLVLWAARSGGNAALFLESLKNIRLWYVMALIFAAAALTFVFVRRENSIQVASSWALAAVGFSSIVYEMVLLIWYQVKVGLLFYRLGIIITAFMVGLGIGAYIAIRLNPPTPPLRKGGKGGFIVLMLLAFAGYMPLLFLVSQVSFPLANFLCGVAAGLLYQMVADALVTKRKLIGSSAGLINFSDYLGAAVGSILASIIMIPLFGLFATLLVAASFLIVAACLSGVLFNADYRSKI